MKNDHFSRLLRLAQKTGDRLIVTGVEGMEPVVILPLDEYESLIENALGLSERGYEVAEEWSMVDEGEAEEVEADEADFDQEELENGALKDLWRGPQSTPASLEVVDRPEPKIDAVPTEVVVDPLPEVAVEQSGSDLNKMAKIRQSTRQSGVGRASVDGGEEQFYLEPIS